MKTHTHIIATALFVLMLSAGCTKLQDEDVVSENAALHADSKPEKPSTKPQSALSVSQQLPNYLERDIKDEIFYFVMPDRFHNGNPNNDNGDPNKPISFGGFDPTHIKGFHGGDIAGVEAKLDYLEQLGITAIWMTPVLRNKAIQQDGFAHHGYWVVDFTEIDPHFGTNDDLKSLIDAAHKRNIKVYFDIITNHTADIIKFEECHNEQGLFIDEESPKCPFKTEAQLSAGDTYTPFILEDEKNAKVPAWLNDIAIYNNQGDSTWSGESVITGDFSGLDDIDTGLPEVQQNMIEVFNNLISEFKPDGFRIDTVKHVDLSFWQVFGPAIINHAQSVGIPEFFIFGEVYDGNPGVLSTFTTSGKMPSVLDFGFHFNVKDALFTGMDVGRLANLFNEDDFYRDHDSTPLELMNFIGNHDAGRTGMFIDQGFPNIDEEERLARSILGHSFMYFSRGIPVVYYGDEQGFASDAGDVGSRENMDPSQVESYNDNNLIGTDKTTVSDNFDQTHPIYQKLADLARIRTAHSALSRGEHHNRFIDVDNSIYAFSRVDSDDMHEYIAVFNFSSEEMIVSFDVDSPEYSTISGYDAAVSEGMLSVTLPKLSYSLIRSTQPLPFIEIKEVTLSPIYKEQQRAFINVDVATDQRAVFEKMAVSFYAIDAQGNETFFATDYTYPYRAILSEEQLDTALIIKAIADNHNGQRVETTLRL
ncbi:MAG: alpha-amylase family glycosyl hydrolase [Pseudomonadota bacterium]